MTRWPCSGFARIVGGGGIWTELGARQHAQLSWRQGVGPPSLLSFFFHVDDETANGWQGSQAAECVMP